MQFLLLWSGQKIGMRKARIPAVINSIGMVGHWRDSVLYLPCPIALRAAIPFHYRKAYDKAVNWHGLPQVWQDATNNAAPLAMHIPSATNARRNLITLYLQPINEGAGE